MTIKLGSNIASLRGLRQLDRTSSSLSETFQRLASGQRINRASDDAAGLAIAEALRTDSRVYSQAVRNVNDGVSLLSIADSALGELAKITTRQIELAEQAANGVYTFKQREALSNEANALVDEFNRIVATTKFNDRQLLLDSEAITSIQAGYGTEAAISTQVGKELARVVGDGTFKDVVTSSASGSSYGSTLADFNGDGHVDFAKVSNIQAQVFLGDSTGSFTSSGTFALDNSGTGLHKNIIAIDVDKDGSLDLVTDANAADSFNISLGNGDGTFQAATSYAVTGLANSTTVDWNGDGYVDVLSSTDNGASVSLNQGDGTFQAATSILTSSGSIYTPEVVDLDQDGDLDLVGRLGSSAVAAYINNEGSFTENSLFSVASAGRVNAVDLNNDGHKDILTSEFSSGSGTRIFSALNNGDGTFGDRIQTSTLTGPYAVNTGDINNDGIVDVVVGGHLSGSGAELGVYLGNGDGGFSESQLIESDRGYYSTQLGDVTGDGVVEIVAGAFSGGGQLQLFSPNTTFSTSQQKLNLFTQEDARTTLDQLSSQLERISSERGSIGSFQQRLNVALGNLETSIENFEEAASRIRSTDVAHESAKATRSSILQQVAASVLAQANQQPQLALQLLR